MKKKKLLNVDAVELKKSCNKPNDTDQHAGSN